METFITQRRLIRQFNQKFMYNYRKFVGVKTFVSLLLNIDVDYGVLEQKKQKFKQMFPRVD